MKLLFLKLLEKKTRLHNLYRIIFYTGLYIQNFARHVDMQFDQYFFAHKPIFYIVNFSRLFYKKFI